MWSKPLVQKVSENEINERVCCKNGSEGELNHSVPYRLGNLQSEGLMDQENLPGHIPFQ